MISGLVRYCAISMVLGLGACAPAPKAPGPAADGLPSGLAASFYEAAADAGRDVYRLHPGDSQVVIHVYRGGKLASLGHDHVVSTRAVHGYVLAGGDAEPGRADVAIAVDRLRVDRAELREQAGFSTKLTQEDIAKTRANMLADVLEAARFSWVLAHMEPGGREGRFRVQLTLHGRQRTLELPVEINRFNGGLRATGGFEILQTDFGITPYSVLGGALKVMDRVRVSFDLVARPVVSTHSAPRKRERASSHSSMLPATMAPTASR